MAVTGSRTAIQRRRTSAATADRRIAVPGVSLAKGPALTVGTVLLAAGLYALYRQHDFPPLSGFPDATVTPAGNKVFSLFAANGWTGELTAVAGGLLLFGSAQHHLARAMNLVVGVCLAVAAIAAAASGDVFGVAAADGWTEIAWGAAAALVLLGAMLPRRHRTVAVAPAAAPAATVDRDRDRDRDADRDVVADRDREPLTARDDREPVTDRDREPVAARDDRDPDGAETGERPRIGPRPADRSAAAAQTDSKPGFLSRLRR